MTHAQLRRRAKVAALVAVLLRAGATDSDDVRKLGPEQWAQASILAGCRRPSAETVAAVAHWFETASRKVA